VFYRERIERLERRLEDLEQGQRDCAASVERRTRLSIGRGSIWELSAFGQSFGEPTHIDLRDAVSKIVDHLGLKFTTIPEKPATVVLQPQPKAKRGK
jgi:hypothetical protein